MSCSAVFASRGAFATPIVAVAVKRLGTALRSAAASSSRRRAARRKADSRGTPGASRPAAAGLPGALDFLERRSRGHRPRVAGRKPRRAVTRPGRSGTPLATADVQALGGFAPQPPDVANRVDAARPRQLGWYRG